MMPSSMGREEGPPDVTGEIDLAWTGPAEI